MVLLYSTKSLQLLTLMIVAGKYLRKKEIITSLRGEVDIFFLYIQYDAE